MIQTGDAVKFVKCTEAQYDEMESKDSATLYFISNKFIALGTEVVGDVTPGEVSAFRNDVGYISSYTETDPMVPEWAKAPNKPTYTASEVGAISTSQPANDITSSDISNWNNKSDFSGSYNDLTDKPTIPSVTTITNTLATGTLIATINGTNIYAPAYTDADNIAY